MGQVNKIASDMFQQDAVMGRYIYDGHFNMSDAVMGDQKYIRLKPGYKGNIEHSEMIGDSIILMISVEKSNTGETHAIRLSHDEQSLAHVPDDSIYILMLEGDTPVIPSLAYLGRITTIINNTKVGKSGPFDSIM